MTGPDNETLRGLAQRRSVRVFTGEAVPSTLKRAVLEAALQAPTAGNQMLYTILDITEPARKARLAELCDHQSFIADAPVVLVFLADCRRWYDAFSAAGCTPRPPREGDALLAVADAVIAAQNAVTAAQSVGLGSCYIGDILENCEQVRALLELPACVLPAAMLVMGWPTPQQKQRKKPVRFGAQYIVQENRYHALDGAQHREMYLERAARAGHPDADWPAEMAAFCKRKYNSDFSREMSRSAAVYLADFAGEDAEP